MKIFLVFAFILLFNLHQANLISLNRNDGRRSLSFDSGRYLLEWKVDFAQELIQFNATAKTLGYVGFGLSKKGKMKGADMIVGGVLSNGKPYFSDRFGIGNEVPFKDPSQDWILHVAQENASHTFLSFSRALRTCDEKHDLEITDNSLAIIWAYGRTDNELEYHGGNRGSQSVYLLDPELNFQNVVSFQWTSKKNLKADGMEILTISDTQIIPAQVTTYSCAVFKHVSNKKQHIIGFNPILPTEVEQKHTHHFILFRCHLPHENPELVFDPVLGLQEPCYILSQPTGKIPTNFCTEMYYVWGIGDDALVLPNHVGLPIGESKTEYFMLQIHFNNPDKLAGMRARYGLEIFVTDKLRKHDAGIITVGKVFPSSPGIMIPPNSKRHVIYGHCGSECTKLMLPPEGIKGFTTKLHTHFAGRKVRIIHIRNGRELAPISPDDNYSPIYQKTRLLRRERLILPGDQLIMRCSFENFGNNGSVTVGGFQGDHEMCIGAIYYYNKIPNRSLCASEMRSEVYRKFFGVYNTTWSNDLLEMVVTSPSHLKELRMSQVGEKINWTETKRLKLQDMHRSLPQISTCPPLVPQQSFNFGGMNTNDILQQQILKQERLFKNWENTEERTFPIENIKYNVQLQNYYKDLNLADYQNEMLNPEFEFVSLYHKNTIPFKNDQVSRNQICSGN